MTKWALILLGVCAAYTSVTSAERYSVKQDSFGNFDAVPSASEKPKKLEETESKVTLSEVSKAHGSQHSRSPESQVSSASAKGLVSEPRANNEQPDDSFSESMQERDESSPSEAQSVGSSSQRAMSRFARAFFESEGQNPYDATKIDEAEYVDGDALLEGRVERPSEQPFFITRDPDGNENIMFYSPSLAREAKESDRVRLRLSQAKVVTEAEKGDWTSLLPEGADPVAASILAAGGARVPSYFSRFAARCCEALPTAGAKVLSFERSEHVTIERDMTSFRFVDGDSRYQLVRLPVSAENYFIELRSYIRRYKHEGVDSGVFFPHLVMLDKQLRPLRVITDAVLAYTPETWSDYGYLQGIFEVDRTNEKEEEYLLVFTTRDSLRQESVYDHPEASIRVKHMRTGSLGLKALSRLSSD